MTEDEEAHRLEYYPGGLEARRGSAVVRRLGNVMKLTDVSLSKVRCYWKEFVPFQELGGKPPSSVGKSHRDE